MKPVVVFLTEQSNLKLYSFGRDLKQRMIPVKLCDSAGSKCANTVVDFDPLDCVLLDSLVQYGDLVIQSGLWKSPTSGAKTLIVI